MTNFIRIPAISADAFNTESQRSLTLAFIQQHEAEFALAANLLELLSDHDEMSDSLASIEALVDDFDDALSLFDEQNLARYVIETHHNLGAGKKALIDILNQRFPLLDFVDADPGIMDERIERKTHNMMNTFYPLYCQPKTEIIQHFLEVCPEIAFMEIGDSNYFAYLTGGGTLLSCQIAYAYLQVDGCIPANILDKHSSVECGNDTVSEALATFFNES